MGGRVYNRFKLLIAQKELAERRNISYDDIHRETGLAISTLSAWANNMIQRFDVSSIATLCEFFHCEVGDLIVYERGN